ncbi:GNAT family N-acetyltransferase [Pseudomonas neuropathica]|uniref:GNAT family N-acetyltransferase n=1 Tax=Pseudomonas neuropathica TaxID=2730425 RepID=UPI003EBB05D1
MSIRRATPEDAVQIARIHWASWQSTYRNIIPEAYLARITVESRLAHWERQIASAELDIQVWTNDAGDVSGWIATGPDRENPGDPNIAEIHALYIAPQHTGKGIGRRLLSHTMAQQKNAGRSRIVLWVLERNESAVIFYRQSGFGKDPVKTQLIERGGAALIELKLQRVIA